MKAIQFFTLTLFLSVISVGFCQDITVHDRLLVISPTKDDATLTAIETYLNKANIDYEVFIASQEKLTWEMLRDNNGIGLFNGILLLEGKLVFWNGITWEIAFQQEDWDLLWSYEEQFNVRQLALYTYPGKAIESYGIREVSPIDTQITPYNLKFTREGKGIFQPDTNDIMISGVYGYLSSIDSGSNIGAIPLLIDAQGNTMAVLSIYKGRERLAFTMGHSETANHTRVLLDGAIAWLRQSGHFSTVLSPLN